MIYDVIIVGGGAAGLMAAKLLSEAGKKILLLEATEKPGGRICRINDLSFPADGGAEFIHGNLRTTFNLLKEAGLKKEKLKGSFCRVTNGRWSADDEIIPDWGLLMKKLSECEEDITVESFLQKYFAQEKFEVICNQFRKYVEGYDAADTQKASIQAIKQEMKNEDDDQYRPETGYEALIDFFTVGLLTNNGIIEVSTVVKKILLKDVVQLNTLTKNYRCHKVIIAVPLGVLQSSKRNKSFIDLPPNAVAYTKAAKKSGNCGVIKFLLEFDSAFWLDKSFLNAKGIPAPSYIFTDAIIPTWWTQFPSKTPLLTGWIGGPPSLKMKNYSDKKFKTLLIDSLASVFSFPAWQLEKRLVNLKVMNWIKEPYFLGGYSFPTLQSEKARHFMNQPFENKIYFAGEYLAKNSSSTVDAALQSGQHVARQILNVD